MCLQVWGVLLLVLKKKKKEKKSYLKPFVTEEEAVCALKTTSVNIMKIWGCGVGDKFWDLIRCYHDTRRYMLGRYSTVQHCERV